MYVCVLSSIYSGLQFTPLGILCGRTSRGVTQEKRSTQDFFVLFSTLLLLSPVLALIVAPPKKGLAGLFPCRLSTLECCCSQNNRFKVRITSTASRAGAVAIIPNAVPRGMMTRWLVLIGFVSTSFGRTSSSKPSGAQHISLLPP